MAEARCRHLVLAKGAGRRSGARHARPRPARGRAARNLCAVAAAAEDLPPDQGRQVDRRDFRGLAWAKRIGGSAELIRRTEANFQAIERWVERTPWIDFLAAAPGTRSTTSVCLVFTDPVFPAKEVAALLEAEGVAFDIGAYRDAPRGLRIWAGATVETADIEALIPWLEWAYGEVQKRHAA
jgi:hypothetical protein